ncbi:Predicted oxidoreductase [Thermostaphylospora chromogena]|uniref:Predicted oxidoreductase n=1 Tax=Thermostaphylospora chromogena TaxID=35622 RepID=A0A1H1EPB7_9ACTN|nr:Predicted oxidoreductase [Thermostaphylospora chromogena]
MAGNSGSHFRLHAPPFTYAVGVRTYQISPAKGCLVEQRVLGRTGRSVGVVGLGAWQLGADWGEVSEDDALATLVAAVDSGVTFIDTADVYGNGRSERLVGALLKERPGLMVATKMGRRAPLDPAYYTLDNFRAWNDDSRANLGVETIDLVQLHTPPSAVFAMDSVYDALDTMVEEGRIAAYGVSVETCEEALTAMKRPGVASIQIILNAFRLKPLERVLPAAREAGVGIIARVPLASGLLSGRYDENTVFADNDHRTYNRRGEVFSIGETFSGVDYEVGLEAVRRLRPLVPEGMTMAQFALRWVIDQPGVSVVIPGARNPEQARANAAAADFPPLTAETLDGVREVYDELIRPRIHHQW